MEFYNDDLIEKKIAWNIDGKSGEYAITKVNAMLDDASWSHIIKYKNSVAKRFFALESSQLENKKVNLGNNLYISIKRDGEFQGLIYDESRTIKSYFVNPNGRIRFGLPVNADFEEIMKKNGIKSALFVGELWYYDPDGKRTRIQDFIRASRTPDGDQDLNQLVFDAFDVIFIDGDYFMGKPFDERFDAISMIFPPSPSSMHEANQSRISVVFTIVNAKNEDIWKYYLEWVQDKEASVSGNGAEGLVVRTAKTNKDFKIKPVFDIDCVIIGYLPNLEDPTILSTLIVALMTDDGQFQYLSKVGGGFSSDDRSEMLKILQEENGVDAGDVIITSTDGRKFHLVEPKHVIKIDYIEILFEDSRGEAKRRLLLDYNADTKAWKRIHMMPFVSLRSPRYIKEGDQLFRDDKKITSYDVGMNQITRFFNLEYSASEVVDLPKSEILFRAVMTRFGKKYGFKKKDLLALNEASLLQIRDDILALNKDGNALAIYTDPDKYLAWINEIIKNKTWGVGNFEPEIRKNYLTKLIAWKTNKNEVDQSYPTFVIYFLDFVGSKDLNIVRTKPFQPEVKCCSNFLQFVGLLTEYIVNKMGYNTERLIGWILKDLKNFIIFPKLPSTSEIGKKTADIQAQFERAVNLLIHGA